MSRAQQRALIRQSLIKAGMTQADVTDTLLDSIFEGMDSSRSRTGERDLCRASTRANAIDIRARDAAWARANRVRYNPRAGAGNLPGGKSAGKMAIVGAFLAGWSAVDDALATVQQLESYDCQLYIDSLVNVARGFDDACNPYTCDRFTSSYDFMNECADGFLQKNLHYNWGLLHKLHEKALTACSRRDNRCAAEGSQE
jgi:hypothetical protein